MISYIEGKIVARGVNHVVVLVGGSADATGGRNGGIGYKIFLTQDSLDTLGAKMVPAKNADRAAEQIALWTHHVVREDAQDLYGFVDQEALRFFELLIGISGIGPKTALSILNLASVKSLRAAVIAGDPDRLTKISGIGKKNAEKIVLELKGKIVAEDGEENAAATDESDALEALKGLGYSERAAREALKKLDKKITGTADRVKHALKALAK